MSESPTIEYSANEREVEELKSKLDRLEDELHRLPEMINGKAELGADNKYTLDDLAIAIADVNRHLSGEISENDRHALIDRLVSLREEYGAIASENFIIRNQLVRDSERQSGIELEIKATEDRLVELERLEEYWDQILATLRNPKKPRMRGFLSTPNIEKT